MTLYPYRYNPHGQAKEIKKIDLDFNPCPTIMAGGVWGDNTSHYWLEDDGKMTQQANSKPPYKVPSMAEIATLPWNGYKVVSTFSGCGGSCLGYRMAGFKVLWASEFIPAAQEVYKLNHPNSILDTRDIRKVRPEEILEAIGLKAGELDLMDGSPPCASFSTAGKREKGWGQVKQYSDTKQRTDDLFFEYTRILRGLQPKVFVAENVSGLVKGTAKGYFKLILQELKDCGYNVKAKLLDAQWLGVPQMRQRVIFMGVRNDLGLEPVYPKPLPYRYSVREALPWIIKQGDNGGFGGGGWQDAQQNPSGTIGTGPQAGNVRFPPSIVEAVKVPVRVINDTHGQWSAGDVTDKVAPTGSQSAHGQWYIEEQVIEPETDISRYAIGEEWDKIGEGGKSDKYLQLVRPSRDGVVNTVTAEGGNTSLASVTHPTEKRKFTIAELKRICAFPDDFILTGSYAQQWERLGRAVPPVMMMAVASVVRDEILAKCK